MSDSQIHIEDHGLLHQLWHATFDYSQSLNEVLSDVDKHINRTIKSFEKQLEILQKQLEEAEKRLQEAEEALRCCENSQEEDEDGNYHPSCDIERYSVEVARKHYSDCKAKVDKAKEIISRANSLATEYRKPGGVLIPPGPEKRLEYLANGFTEEANQKLSKINEAVADYLEISISIVPYDGRDERYRSLDDEVYEQITDDNKRREYKQKFQEAKERIQKKQEVDNRHLVAVQTFNDRNR